MEASPLARFAQANDGADSFSHWKVGWHASAPCLGGQQAGRQRTWLWPRRDLSAAAGHQQVIWKGYEWGRLACWAAPGPTTSAAAPQSRQGRSAGWNCWWLWGAPEYLSLMVWHGLLWPLSWTWFIPISTIKWPLLQSRVHCIHGELIIWISMSTKNPHFSMSPQPNVNDNFF